MRAKILTNDNIFSVVLLIACVLAWRTLEGASYYGALFPRVVIIILAFLTVINLIQGLRSPEQVAIFEGEKKIYIFIMLIGILAYVWLITVIGFLLASLLFMAVFFWLLGDERTLKTAAKSVVFALVIGTSFNYLFVNIFSIPLPRGPFGF